MLLDIGRGWQIDTSINEDTDEPWADLWHKGRVVMFQGENCLERCLNRFREIMDMCEDDINEWQREEMK